MFSKLRPAGVDWLVVFLGNPGPKYAKTRHNAGFMAADRFEAAQGVKINRLRFNALTARCTLGKQNLLLLKPQTFMNLSGKAAAQAAKFYKIPPERILAVFDDVSLPPGKLRIRQSGSAGGHNGIKSLIAELGSEAFPRIKIGVGAQPHPDYDLADWVLGTLSGKELELVGDAAGRAAEAIELYIRNGADLAMSKFN